jgi:uncharacterized protein YaaN involved in tellurite resistance
MESGDDEISNKRSKMDELATQNSGQELQAIIEELSQLQRNFDALKKKIYDYMMLHPPTKTVFHIYYSI